MKQKLNTEENAITDIEFKDSLRVLEEESKIQLFGHKSAPVIRII
jgi:hypothetical protein